MKPWKRLWKDQRGQSLIFYAGAILVTVLLLAGLLEVGWWSSHYYQARQGVDLAAVSAAQYIPLSTEEINDSYGSRTSLDQTVYVARNVFKENYEIRDFPITTIFYKFGSIPGWNKVTVQHREDLPMMLLPAFMKSMEYDPYIQIKVMATAKAEALYQPTHVVPIGLIKKDSYVLEYGKTVTIDGKISAPALGTSNLSLGILDPTKNGTMSDSNAVDWIKNEYKARDMKIANDTAPWKKTVDVQAVVDTVNQRIANGKNKILVPVVSPTVNARGEVTIYGYACLELTSSAKNLTNGSMSLTGKFVKYVDNASDRKPSSITSNAKYYGVRVIYLDE